MNVSDTNPPTSILRKKTHEQRNSSVHFDSFVGFLVGFNDIDTD